MLKYVSGDIFESEAELIVNPVNTRGVMGKGLALAFRDKYPKNYDAYRRCCLAGKLAVGGIFYNDEERKILNVATKDHWKYESRIEWIKLALDNILTFATSNNIKSVAIPLLGGGLGGLPVIDVMCAIHRKLNNAEYPIEFIIYKNQLALTYLKAEQLTEPTPGHIDDLARQLEFENANWFILPRMYVELHKYNVRLALMEENGDFSGEFKCDDNGVYIYLAVDRDVDYTRGTFIHELVHVKQFLRNSISFSDEGVLYRNVLVSAPIFSDESIPDYYVRDKGSKSDVGTALMSMLQPYEVEAYLHGEVNLLKVAVLTIIPILLTLRVGKVGFCLKDDKLIHDLIAIAGVYYIISANYTEDDPALYTDLTALFFNGNTRDRFITKLPRLVKDIASPIKDITKQHLLIYRYLRLLIKEVNR